MKASEIVDKFKNVLLNTEIENDDKITEVSDVEVNEEDEEDEDDEPKKLRISNFAKLLCS